MMKKNMARYTALLLVSCLMLTLISVVNVEASGSMVIPDFDIEIDLTEGDQVQTVDVIGINGEEATITVEFQRKEPLARSTIDYVAGVLTVRYTSLTNRIEYKVDTSPNYTFTAVYGLDLTCATFQILNYTLDIYNNAKVARFDAYGSFVGIGTLTFYLQAEIVGNKIVITNN